MLNRPAMTHDRSEMLRDFLVVGNVAGDFAVFVVFGDEAKGCKGIDRVLDFGFTAGGVFELGGDHLHGPFSALGAQEVPDVGELVFEVFGPGLLGGGCGNCRLQRSTTLFPKSA
jgi:hypothetical protein